MAAWFHFQSGSITALASAPLALPEQGFYWLDCRLDEAPNTWLDSVQALLPHPLDELHLEDLNNLQHPSHFDMGEGYSFLVIRSLSGKPLFDQSNRLQIKTRPAFFVLADRFLLTCHSSDSRTFEALHHFVAHGPASSNKNARYATSDQFLKFKRQPHTADEMMIQIISGLVDRYLDIRIEISERLDRWQRDLLNTRKRFEDWEALLAARNELNRLETVAEDQTDALADWLDYRDKKNKADQAVLVKIRDTLEHLKRVSNLAARLGSNTEAAVQLHFSSTAHKTNELVSVLTLLSAVFMPLTLLTGLFGMNFESMPLLKNPHGFWLAAAIMLASSTTLVLLILHLRNKSHRK